MENFKEYEDQELIEEVNIAAWAAVMHEGDLRAKAWARFEAVSLELRSRYPASAPSQPATIPTR